MVKRSMNSNKSLAALKSHPQGRFKACPYYDPDSDSVTLYMANDESKRERVDRFLTVYRSIESNDVIGCHIKFVKKVLSTVQAFKIGIKTDSMTIGLLLIAAPLAELEDRDEPITLQSRQYREVARVAGSVKVELPDLVGCDSR